MSKTLKIIFAIDQTTADGKDHAGGSSATLPYAEAREFVYDGLARLADTDTPTNPQAGGEGDKVKDTAHG